ncbi:MAG: YfhO family protein [Bacteroidales bacterium]|jgi:hypothetical protein|nr:YfhO family protein [Bacteroidales bacterium]
MKNKELWKKLLPYGVALVCFTLFALIYCAPVFEGKVLNAGDVKTAAGEQHETAEFYKETGIRSFWTNSMFSGMPHLGSPPSTDSLKVLGRTISLGFPYPLCYFIAYLLGFFIFLRAFKINAWLSIAGSMALTLSSYFLIIVAAGHVSKAISIATTAPIIAGFILIYRKKYLLGVVLTVFYSIHAFMSHPQMFYYFSLFIGCLFLAELFIHIKERRWRDLLVATLLFGCSLGVGLGTRYSSIMLNQEYVVETMRGGHSELSKDKDSDNKTGGLDLDYATAWSYGIDETFTLLIPHFKGSSSNYNVGTDSKVYQTLVQNNVPRKNAADFCTNVPTYWGTQPFTAGPVYVGAIIFFLFMLGLFIVKGPYKWALLAATLFSILLSWGHHFMPLTRLFFDYFPLYNKFRAVSSILVVAEVTIPLLGLLAIKEIMDKKIAKEVIIKRIYLSAGITAGICLFFALFGNFIYTFTSPNDESIFAQFPEWLRDAVIAQRASLFTADCWRSFFFIIAGAALLWLFVKEKLKLIPFVVSLGVLFLADLWTVNRRYFNDDNFVTEKQDKNFFKKQPYEEEILQDKDPNFRVFNLASNTFNESRTSYYFKSLGGYSGIKLRRYQDLIDKHLSKMNWEVINMLNAKYIIFSTQDGRTVYQQNPAAMGNAWFVDSLYLVGTPDAESEALDSLDLHSIAVVDTSKFGAFVKGIPLYRDTTSTVELLSCKPNELEYQTHNSRAGTIVFSEIYYPHGWQAFIDEQPVEHFRANYVLRALHVPEGDHRVRFYFYPDSLRETEPVSIACIAITYILLASAVVYAIIRWKRKKTSLKA